MSTHLPVNLQAAFLALLDRRLDACQREEFQKPGAAGEVLRELLDEIVGTDGPATVAWVQLKMRLQYHPQKRVDR